MLEEHEGFLEEEPKERRPLDGQGRTGEKQRPRGWNECVCVCVAEGGWVLGGRRG